MSKKLDEFVTYWHQCSGVNVNVEDFIEHARALEDMLRKHEWDEDWEDVTIRRCPECAASSYYPFVDMKHAPDCALAKLLE